MSLEKLHNLIYGKVETAPSPADSGTSFVVNYTLYGQFIPDPSVVGSFPITMFPVGEFPHMGNSEIMLVTAVVQDSGSDTTTLTVTRQYEEASLNRSVAVGDQFILSLTAQSMRDVLANGENLLRNGNFINNSTNGYGATPDDWISSSANPIQGGFPTFTKQNLIDILGITDGDIEGLWKLDEASGNAVDLSSNGYNLTDNNTVASSDDGLMAKARDFEATNSEYFSIADGSAPNLEITGSKTWFFHWKPETLSLQVLMAKVAGAAGTQIFMTGSDGVLQWYCNGLATTPTLNSDVKLEAGKLYQVVCVYDSANSLTKIWINGIKKQATATGSTTDSNAPFYLGRNDGGNYADGIMQLSGVLSVALSDDQVKRFWAYTTYRGQKIRRATTDALLYQDASAPMLEQLRGKVVTLTAQVYVESTNHRIYIDDGTTITPVSPSATGAWETISITALIPATASRVRVGIEADTTDGNMWIREARLTPGYIPQPYCHSQNDLSRFPRLIRMDIPKVISAYQFEENRWYDWTPLYSGGGTMTYTSVTTDIAKFMLRGKQVFLTINASGTTGGTANSNLQFTPPVAPVFAGDFDSVNMSLSEDGSSSARSVGYVFWSKSGVLVVRKSDSSNWGLGAGRAFYTSPNYGID